MEIMVVIAIIGIMSAVALVSLSKGKEQKAVEAAAREVASAIREAQNYALTGKGADSTCTIYIFFCTNLSANYSIACGSNAINYTLKNGVNFDSGCTSTNIIFPIPWATLSVNPDAIVLKKGNSCYQIDVNIAGNITESSITCP